MKPDDTISVIIPAFNAEQSLGRAIESVLAQERLPNEIIVMDDGSVDATSQVAAQYPEVTCCRQDNMGSSSARNAGIQASSGQWIAFLDADDRWKPDRLSKQVAILSAHPDVRWAAGQYEMLRPNETSLSRTPGAEELACDGIANDALELMARGWKIWTGAVLVHRELVSGDAPFDVQQRTSHDVDLWLRLGASHPKIAYVLSPIAEYTCENVGSLTRTAVSNHDRTQLLVYEKGLNLAESIGSQRGNHIKSYLNSLAFNSVKTALWRGARDRAKWLLGRFVSLGFSFPKWLTVATLVPSAVLVPAHRIFCHFIRGIRPS